MVPRAWTTTGQRSFAVNGPTVWNSLPAALPAPEHLNWIKKWLTPFMMGTMSYTTLQSLGEIVQCAPAVGAKMWCLYVFCHAPRPVHSLFEGELAGFKHHLKTYLFEH